jgi:hypothetical protein
MTKKFYNVYTNSEGSPRVGNAYSSVKECDKMWKKNNHADDGFTRLLVLEVLHVVDSYGVVHEV